MFIRPRGTDPDAGPEDAGVEGTDTDQLPAAPEKNTSRYLPICTSSPSVSRTESMRSRLT